MSSTKKCERCHNDFVCNPANIQVCQCSNISFTEAEKEFIKQQAFSDCLCVHCLRELKTLAQQHSSQE